MENETKEDAAKKLTAKAFLVRYQDIIGWLPLVALLAVGAIIVFGALTPDVGPAMLAVLTEVPVRSAFILAALGLTYIAWRRWRFDVTDEQKKLFWDKLIEHPWGPIVVHITNMVFYLVMAFMIIFAIMPKK